MQPQERRMGTTRTAARMIDVSMATFRRWLNDPSIKPPLPRPYRLGPSNNSIRYDLQELALWIEARKAVGAVECRHDELQGVRAKRSQRESAGKNARPS